MTTDKEVAEAAQAAQVEHLRWRREFVSIAVFTALLSRDCRSLPDEWCAPVAVKLADLLIEELDK